MDRSSIGGHALGVLLLFTATACDKIPGTEAYKHRTSIEGAQAAASYKLIDPSSAQFRNVSVTNDFACGEVNGKNRMGAYAGFLRFTASRDKGKWTATLDPQFDQERYKQVQQECKLAGSTHNALLAETSCRESMEMTVQQIPQIGFDQTWDMLCKPKAQP
jgi:hypothetical protein